MLKNYQFKTYSKGGCDDISSHRSKSLLGNTMGCAWAD